MRRDPPLKRCDLHPYYPRKYCWDCVHKEGEENIRRIWDSVEKRLREKQEGRNLQEDIEARKNLQD